MNIGIIGVGKLGLAYALIFEKKGYHVVASSYKEEYVNQLIKRETDSIEPGVAEALAVSNIDFTIDNHHVINSCDIIYVMVATPSTPNGDYDVSAVNQVADDFLSHPLSVAGKILVVGSTVNPGTCNELEKKLSGLGVHVVYSPTFVAQGSVIRDIQDPHSLLIGTDNAEIAKICQNVFSTICGENTPVTIVQPTTAEILKLAGNCKATMEISYFNMISTALIKSGMDKDLDAASLYLNFVKVTGRWKHGFGYGGPCYPRDNRAFVKFFNRLGMDFPLGKVIDEFNQDHVLFLTNYFINDNVNKLPFYFEYVTYKRGVNIIEESHQYRVCKKLLEQGYTVYIENSKFLPDSVVKELSSTFENVKFINYSDLTNKSILVYNVTNF